MKRQKYEAEIRDISFKCTHCDCQHRHSPKTPYDEETYHFCKVSCEHCDFKAYSDIELESHNIINHKPKLPAIERERNEYLNESLQLSVSKEV